MTLILTKAAMWTRSLNSVLLASFGLSPAPNPSGVLARLSGPPRAAERARRREARLPFGARRCVPNREVSRTEWGGAQTPEGIGAANKDRRVRLLNHCGILGIFKDQEQREVALTSDAPLPWIVHAFQELGTLKHQRLPLVTGFPRDFRTLSSDFGSALRTPPGT